VNLFESDRWICEEPPLAAAGPAYGRRRAAVRSTFLIAQLNLANVFGGLLLPCELDVQGCGTGLISLRTGLGRSGTRRLAPMHHRTLLVELFMAPEQEQR